MLNHKTSSLWDKLKPDAALLPDYSLILLTVIPGFSSCKSNQKDIIPSAEYAPYVNAYTGGVISQNSTIRIELTHDQPMVDLNSELKNNPFSFSPSLKGKRTG